MNYTARELMVVCAARQIRDGEKVFVGMRLPLLAFALAKLTHAPNCIGLFELGVIRDVPAPELLYTMGDGPNIAGSVWATGTVNVWCRAATQSGPGSPPAVGGYGRGARADRLHHGPSRATAARRMPGGSHTMAP